MEAGLFTPNAMCSFNFAVTTSPAAYALPAGGGLILQLTNVGTANAYIEFGQNNQIAAAVPGPTTPGSYPITCNEPVSILLRATDTFLSVIADANTHVLVARAKFI